LFGWGLSSFDLTLEDHATPFFLKRIGADFNKLGAMDRTHNLWWELLVETGVIGLVLWAAAMGSAADTALVAVANDSPHRNLIVAGILSLLSYMLYQLFNPSDVGSVTIFWCVLGWTLAVSSPKSVEIKNKPVSYLTQALLIVAAFGTGYGLWMWW